MTDPLNLAEATAALTAPGQLFEMEDVVVHGVALRAWKAAPASLRTVLDLSLGHGDTEYLVYGNRRITYAQHYRIAATLAHRLRDELGVEKGDRVAIAMRNLPEWVMAFWAAAVAGAVVVPLNAWWTAEELAYGLADSGSVVAFVDADRADRVRPHLGSLHTLRALVVTDETDGAPAEASEAPVVDGEAPAEASEAPVVAGGGTPAPGPAATWRFDELLGDVSPDAVPPDVDIDTDDDATIFYTSGTTGRPKGAVGTHRNTCTNLMSLFFVTSRNQLRTGEGPGDPGAEGQRCYLLSVPFFHATGCHAVLVTNTAAGSKLVLMHHFDPELALELIERERVTIFGGVPTVVMRILDSPDLTRRDLSSVRSVSYGGAPAPPDLVRRIRQTFPTGQPGNGYGLTETSAATAMNSGEDYVKKPDSVGPAVPVADVAIVPDGEDGGEPPATAPGTVGELWVKGPHVVRGYWNRPHDTATAFTNGWFHTGDVARIDDEGFIYIVDRAKDVVIRGGENVYSVEVEDVLFDHPAVAECAVIGVPHPVLGEEVGAVIVLRPGAKVTAEELADHVRRRLAGFNVPTHLWFRSRPLPRNAAGKVLKRVLRDEVLGGASGTAGDGPLGGAGEGGAWGGGDTSAWDESGNGTGRARSSSPGPDSPSPD